MNYVNFTPIIDVSSIIWDINDFNAKEEKYHKLKASVTALFSVLENKRLKFLLRNELLNEIRGGFPINNVSNDFNDFYGLVQSFFSKIDFIQYSASNDLSVQSKPDLKKAHFTNSTKDEIQHLITRIHNGDEVSKIYLTFEMLWDGTYNELITLENGNNEIRHERIISDVSEKLKNSLKRFELKFEHHEKHNRTWGYYKKGVNLVSPLSCYDNNNNDDSRSQMLLDTAIKHGEFYYNFDEIYEVYVRFVKTQDNIYHAHDVSDICDVSPNSVAVTFTENNLPIPEKIKSKYMKRVTRGRGIDEYGKWIG